MGNYNKFAKEYAEQTDAMEREVRKHFYSLIKVPLKNKYLLEQSAIAISRGSQK